ncbi:hypothetical protein J2853_004347 [Streptosporangium lutulentum]|uniref:Uncharacterized protein n=1 Tax=Streptosporangium lutulentum TaxID=1461250 RepID=A0ABT9QFM0_9ACTN|nr:hypothetical protein [Streptosporangium lutulentum]
MTDRAQTRRVIERTAHGRDATHPHPHPHPFAGRAGLDILDAPLTVGAVPSGAASLSAAPLSAVPWNAVSTDAVSSRRRPVHAGSDSAGTPEGAVNVHRNR